MDDLPLIPMTTGGGDDAGQRIGCRDHGQRPRTVPTTAHAASDIECHQQIRKHRTGRRWQKAGAAGDRPAAEIAHRPAAAGKAAGDGASSCASWASTTSGNSTSHHRQEMETSRLAGAARMSITPPPHGKHTQIRHAGRRLHDALPRHREKKAAPRNRQPLSWDSQSSGTRPAGPGTGWSRGWACGGASRGPSRKPSLR